MRGLVFLLLLTGQFVFCVWFFFSAILFSIVFYKRHTWVTCLFMWFDWSYTKRMLSIKSVIFHFFRVNIAFDVFLQYRTREILAWLTMHARTDKFLKGSRHFDEVFRGPTDAIFSFASSVYSGLIRPKAVAAATLSDLEQSCQDILTCSSTFCIFCNTTQFDKAIVPHPVFIQC